MIGLRACLLLLPLSSGLTGCIGGDGFDFIADGPFPVFEETTTTKQLTLTLDDLNPVQRYQLLASVNPGTFEAHVDVSVRRATAVFGFEITEEAFASNEPAFWPGADVGFLFQTRSAGNGRDLLRLSVARFPENAGQQVSIDLEVVLAAPNDVDFDGVGDDVTVELGPLDPVVLDE